MFTLRPEPPSGGFHAGVAALVLGALLCAAPSAHAQATPPTTPAPQASMDLVAPKLVTDPTVPYPEGAAGDATVVLLVTVNADGSVRLAEPTEKVEPFASVAVKAALGWRFEPAMRGDHPVAAKIKIEVVFHAPVTVVSNEEAVEPTGPKGDAKPKIVRPVEEVRVRGARAEASRTVTLTRAEVRQIPGVFGDPFRAIEVMPGVTPIVSGLPFFFIRGAPPGNVGYFLDGIPVPYLFHVGAGPSVVHPGLIERVDLYPGGYPASFGRYSGGIVSGETVKPADATHGEYNVRLFDVGALAETRFANNRGSVLVGGRYSYTALLLTLLNSNVALDYWDYQARVTYDLTPRDQVSVFTFGAYDFLGQKTPTGTTTVFGADFYRVDVRYDHRIDADSTMRTAVTLGLDRTQLDAGRVLRDRLVRARNEISYRVSERALVRVGTDAQLDTYDIQLPAADLGPAQARLTSLFPSRTDVSLGAHADVVVEAGSRLEITPGARLDFYTSEG
ncbi:MAG: TonB family protein / TonB-dependent receptor, partial [Myxococcaceae bacterium]|nr:TonB family protein / TonB-dependent receptor [Myxococcaceae bacterium]